MFIKTFFKRLNKKFKNIEILYQNAIYVCIFDIGKSADIWRKNSDISRNQRVCHVIDMLFVFSLGKV